MREFLTISFSFKVISQNEYTSLMNTLSYNNPALSSGLSTIPEYSYFYDHRTRLFSCRDPQFLACKVFII